MNTELPKKRLQQDKVTKYAKLCAEIAKLEKQKLKLRSKLIKQLEVGYICPKSGPYLIVLTYQERHPIAWKEEWSELAKRIYGAKKRKVMLAQLVEDAPLVKTPMLLPRVNPDYRTVTNVVTFKKEVA